MVCKHCEFEYRENEDSPLLLKWALVVGAVLGVIFINTGWLGWLSWFFEGAVGALVALVSMLVLGFLSDLIKETLKNN